MELTVPTHPDAISIGSSLPSQISLDGDFISFQVIWHNVSVVIDVKNQRREILSRFCGNVKNGEIVAILGPSGSGKTTFLNCLAGNRRPTEGSIQYYAKTKRNAIAYVPQTDNLNPYLTVKETLLFSSKFKNSSKQVDHNKIVEKIIQELGLDDCMNNLIEKCSGGEAKRVAVAVEMTSNPNMFLIDEMTSGLDSHTAFRCVDVLKSSIIFSARKPMIVMTIHQPNTDLFGLFDRIYLLANGSCVYEGPPSNVVEYFSSYQLFCPMYFNPADFALNIASNHYGNLAVQELKQSIQKENEMPPRPEIGLKPMKQSYLKRKTSFFPNYCLLLKSMILSYVRDPQQSIFRISENITLPLLIFFLLKNDVSSESGCVLKMHNDTHVMRESVYERSDRQTVAVTNLFLLYFNALFVFFSASFPGVLVFPLRLSVFEREQQNNWYSTASFFAAFITVNTLFSTVYAMLNTSMFYYLTQTNSSAQLSSLFVINVLLAYFGDCTSFLVSLFVPTDPLGGAVLIGCLGFILQSFSGFLIKINYYRKLASILSFTSIFRYYFEACTKIFYGGSQCIIGEDKVLDFDTVLDFIRYYNHKSDEKLEDIESIPPKVKTSLSEVTWTKDKLFKFAIEANDISEEKIAELDSFWISKANFILDEFQIPMNGILVDIAVMIAMIIMCYIFCFICLVVLRRKKH